METLRVRDRLEQQASQDFIGRTHETERLVCLLDPGGSVVAFLHGIGGIGKTALVEHFAREARRRGASVVQLDGRAIEPTEAGFLRELGLAIGRRLPNTEAAALRLAELGDPLVLVVDTYEVLRLLDTWVRQSFVPSLPQGVRVVLSGRAGPVSGWLTAPGWHGLFTTIHLESLPERQAFELLSHHEIDEPQARRLNRFARGHPLALKLAAAAARAQPALDLQQTFSPAVVETLTRFYLSDVEDALTREALEAVSVARRVTHTLLATLIPDAAPSDLEARLRDLPFVEAARDGLVVHDVVREAISSALNASDPVRHRLLRHAAWQRLKHELEIAGPDELWRYTADLLYLIENPVIREAFFPSDHQPFAIEPALPDHGEAILRIVRRRDGPESAEQLGAWWDLTPESFRVVRDRAGGVTGFLCMFDTASVPRSALGRDPVLGPVCRHLADQPLPNGQRALMLRRWLSSEHGESPSPVQAACWIDCKRFYLEMRSQLRRVYVTAQDVEPYADVLGCLGFRFRPDEVPVDDASHRVAVLDFGPGLVGGWMSGIVGAELGVRADPTLDEHARELVIQGERIRLTRLQFRVMEHMLARGHEVARRNEMLADIWGGRRNGSSNVVDVVIRSLRKKLEDLPCSIETVRGVGYRLRIGSLDPLSPTSRVDRDRVGPLTESE